MHAIFVFERSDGGCRLVHRASQFYPPARLGIPLPLLSALSGKGMPLSVEIPCVLAIYGLASILQRKDSFFRIFLRYDSLVSGKFHAR
jgi:hypothetical protein